MAIRKPYRGVRNIILFNWHYYALSVILILVCTIAINFYPSRLNSWIALLIILFAALNVVSILVSYYIFDASGLYKFDWLKGFDVSPGTRIFNIHAGYDETSSVIKERFPNAELIVYDFFNPDKHTEVSIRRARKAYPPFPGTTNIDTNRIPSKDSSAELILLFLAGHEIRDDLERKLFFQELRRILRKNGQIIVIEHMRDMANLIAYNIGAFHFFSERSWLETFAAADLVVADKNKITPFITMFIIKQDGSPHKN